MSADERAEVLRFVKDFANDEELLVAGTNGSSTREVIEHTERARDIGYDKVLLATPYYTRPTDDELLAHYLSVLDAVDVELVLYSYPAKDGIEVGFSVLNALADDPRVIGIKESSGVMQRAIDIYSRYNGRIDLVQAPTTSRWISCCGVRIAGSVVHRTAWHRPAWTWIEASARVNWIEHASKC